MLDPELVRGVIIGSALVLSIWLCSALSKIGDGLVGIAEFLKKEETKRGKHCR